MKVSMILCCSLVIVAGAFSQEAPKRDYVPNSDTAVAIGEAVLIPVYGKKLVESERPFKATLKGDVWTVAGTLHCAPSCVGGTAEVKISKQDARIIAMTHYK